MSPRTFQSTPGHKQHSILLKSAEIHTFSFCAMRIFWFAGQSSLMLVTTKYTEFKWTSLTQPAQSQVVDVFPNKIHGMPEGTTGTKWRVNDCRSYHNLNHRIITTTRLESLTVWPSLQCASDYDWSPSSGSFKSCLTYNHYQQMNRSFSSTSQQLLMESNMSSSSYRK